MRYCVKILCLSVLLTACASSVTYRGYVPDDTVLANLRPNISDKQKVLSILGTPPLYGVMQDNVWYYVSQREETAAFNHPTVTERKVLVLSFNGNVLQSSDTYTLKDGKAIALNPETTPVYGRDLNGVQEFLSNLGRFNQVGPKNKGNIPN